MPRKTTKLKRRGDNLVAEHFVDPQGEEHSIYEFDVDKIIDHCESIEGVERQLYYLEYVLKQRRACTNHYLTYAILDVDRESRPFFKRQTEELFALFQRRLKLEIDFREKILPITKTTRKEGPSKVPLFDFDPEQTAVHCESLQSDESCIAYLEEVLREAEKGGADTAPLQQLLLSKRMFALFECDCEKIFANCDKLGPHDQLEYLLYVHTKARLAFERGNYKFLNDFKTLYDYRDSRQALRHGGQRINKSGEALDNPPLNGLVVQKIEWQGETTQLAYLIGRLVELKLWPTDKQWALVAKHFVDRNGKPLTSQSLTSAFAKLDRNINKKPKRGEAIDEVLADTLKIR